MLLNPADALAEGGMGARKVRLRALASRHSEYCRATMTQAIKAPVLVRPFIICCIPTIRLVGAGAKHAHIPLSHGVELGPRRNASARLRIPNGWTALTFLDPLAAVLLLARPRLDRMLTAPNITVISDVALNAWIRTMRGVQFDAFIAQGMFLGLVLATARFGWPRDVLSLSECTMTMGFPPVAR